MVNRVGQQLGNYRLMRLLGRGSFAEVYLGEHTRLRTQSAIKVLYTHLADYNVEEFLTEARTIARLEHPNIVEVLDYDVQEGTAFLVMKYASNGSLRQYYPRGTRLPLTTAILYVKQVAEALQYAHEKQLIHRDIKPENMLLGQSNEILLSDFGIALIAQSSRLQSTQDIIGTAHYMAPEQLQGRPRLASDQYALAVVVYEWLSGEYPFHGTFSELYSQHLFVAPPPLREKVPGLPFEVEQVVLTALAKNPDQRFASVRTFATALEQASLGYPTTTTPLFHVPLVFAPPMREPVPTETPQSSKSLLSRRTVFIGLVGGLAGLAAMGGGLAWLMSSQGLHSPSLSPSPNTDTTVSTPLPQGTTILIYRGHSNGISSVTWAPDNKRIASGSNDMSVQVWDSISGITYLFYRNQKEEYAVAWSPNGKRIASGSLDTTVQVWDPTTGGHVLTYRGHQGLVLGVAWSPDGKRIASTGEDNTVQIWNPIDGTNIFTYHSQTTVISSIAWSHDGKRIASSEGSAGNNVVQVWDTNDGSIYFTYHGHHAYVGGLAWSPDGKRIASASDDHTTQVWDATDGSNAIIYRSQSLETYAVAWSPSGKYIASANADNTVQIWKAATGGHIFTYRGHAYGVRTVAWSPDGQRIASGSQDKTVQVWQAV